MNVWPLLHRELLVGARKNSTHRLRVGMALSSSLLGAAYLFSFSNAGGVPVGMRGSMLFQILAWMAFSITGLFGVFFAADAISSERRDGTLGLLFLTRLKGLDVVLGKLTSTSLRSAYALMAGLPVIALPILLGGVTFKVYCYTALVLANTLFLSVSAGLLVSSYCRKSVPAVMGTLVLVLSMAGIPIVLDTVWVELSGLQWAPFVSHLSPGYSLFRSLSAASGGFLWVVLFQHIVGWVFLSIAALRTSRITEKVRQPVKAKALRRMFSSTDTKTARQLRDRSPIQWLISHGSRGPRIMSLIILALMGVGFAVGLNSNGQSQTPWVIGLNVGQGLLRLVLMVCLTVEAARQTGDARHTDAFELLLATPLTTAEIVSGFFRGIWRIFGLAVVTLISLQLLGTWLALVGQNMNAAVGRISISSSDVMALQIISAVFGVINLLATCIALVWVGMWMGLRSEQTTAAAAKAFVLVVVVPGIVVSIGVGILLSIGMAATGVTSIWLNAVIMGVTSLAVKIGFIVWARKQLLTHFREAANGTLSRGRIRKLKAVPLASKS